MEDCSQINAYAVPNSGGLKEHELTHSRATTFNSITSLDLSEYPYLQRLERLQDAYPALGPLLAKQLNAADEGRRLVTKRYTNLPGNTAGRCAVLIFHDNHVEHEKTLESAEELSEYLARVPPARDVPKRQCRRLFILEDMEPGFVDTLGQKLGVNPMIFSEQMNTWNFTDSRSVSYRSLPSVASPETLFTIRYYELRTLDHKEDPQTLRARMTFGLNRRKCERWRDLDLPSIDPDQTHGFIRRCASFWTSHESKADRWDALILVDPPLDSCNTCVSHRSDPRPEPYHTCQPTCLMLEDPTCYRSRKEMWKSRRWNQKDSVRAVRHRSKPYHGGITTIIRPFLCYADGARRTSLIESKIRNQASPFDELIFYWTECAEPRAIEATKHGAVNCAYYLLKFVAGTWDNQLEFIAHSVANSEWFRDDHEAGMDTDSSTHDWKREFSLISAASKDINYMRRRIGQFQQAMTLNLERMGIQLGAETVGHDVPLAIKGAQQDFLAIYSRLTPLRARVDDLSSIANEVATLRAAFKSIEDGSNGLKLSLFLVVFFPLTLVASMFSMGENYLPGNKNFWMFWASSVPLSLVIGAVMMYSQILGIYNIWKKSKALESKTMSNKNFEPV